MMEEGVTISLPDYSEQEIRQGLVERCIILTPDWLQGLAGVQWPGAEPPGGAGGGHQGGPAAGGQHFS